MIKAYFKILINNDLIIYKKTNKYFYAHVFTKKIT